MQAVAAACPLTCRRAPPAAAAPLRPAPRCPPAASGAPPEQSRGQRVEVGLESGDNAWKSTVSDAAFPCCCSAATPASAVPSELPGTHQCNRSALSVPPPAPACQPRATSSVRVSGVDHSTAQPAHQAQRSALSGKGLLRVEAHRVGHGVHLLLHCHHLLRIIDRLLPAWRAQVRAQQAWVPCAPAGRQADGRQGAAGARATHTLPPPPASHASCCSQPPA